VRLAISVTWGPLVSGTCGFLQLMRVARARFGEHDSPGSINPRRGRGEPLTSTLSICCPFLLAFASERCVPFRFRPMPASSSRASANRNGSPAANHGVATAAVDPLDGDEVCPERACERRLAGAECRWAAPGVDCSADNGSGAQTRRTATSSASSDTTSTASPRRRAALCADCATTTGWNCTTSPRRDFAGSHIRRRLRGIPGDPSELGSLGPPPPHRAAHTRYARAADAPHGARRWPIDLAAGHAQGVLHPLHDDLQQRGMGAGVVLPPQQRRRPPPTPARC
jgi:hypothetical protein